MTEGKSFIGRHLYRVLISLIAVKLYLVSDVVVHIRFSPFDDSLYVDRAYEFLTGGYWGKYDAHTLAKLPGISLWLVASRWLGVPYLLGINVLYCLAGLLLVRASAKAGVENKVLLAAYILYLCNPVTFSAGWEFVMREALSTILTVTLLWLSLEILVSSKDKLPWCWVIAWGAFFAFAQFLREEDALLWGYLALFCGIATWLRRDLLTKRLDQKLACVLLVIPTLLTLTAGSSLRSYNMAHYGAPLLNDYSEGEFPKLMATLRSIESQTDNRMVMLPQDVINQLRLLVPDFLPVLDRLPAPGGNTFSCRLHGVCSEWSNGWMPWWVKQASAEAGLTPSLADGQAYFKMIREQIVVLCQNGQIHCKPKGEGILQPMELRWFRAYLQELFRILKLLIYPIEDEAFASNQTANAPQLLKEIYQQVTMTRVDANPAIEGDNTFGYLPALREVLRSAGVLFTSAAVIIGSLAIVWQWVMFPKAPATMTYMLCLLFWSYSLLRLSALAYVAVFLGPFEPRIVYSTYTGLGILGFLVTCESIKQYKTSVYKVKTCAIY